MKISDIFHTFNTTPEHITKRINRKERAIQSTYNWTLHRAFIYVLYSKNNDEQIKLIYSVYSVRCIYNYEY